MAETKPKRERRHKTVKGMTFQEQPDGSFALAAATDEQLQNADREMFSHSLASDLADNKCPAAVLAKNNLPRKEHPFDANVKGSGAHDVLEHVYQRPPLMRTEDAFREVADEVAKRFWSQDKLADQFPMTLDANRQLKAEWLSTIKEWALRVLLLENPMEIDVIGTEFEFKGQTTSNGIVSTGKIDRLDRIGRRGGRDIVRIVDYKYGKWKGEPNPKFGDDYADQQYRYEDLVEFNLGHEVGEMNILYPREPHRRVIKLDEAAKQDSLRRYAQAREDLTFMIAERRFPVRPGGLCGWCDLARACPIAKIPRVENAVGTKWKTKEQAVAAAKNALRSAATKRSSETLGIRIISKNATDLGLNDDSYIIAFGEIDARERAAEEAARCISPGSEPMPAAGKELKMTTQVQQPRAEATPSTELAVGRLNFNSWAAKNVCDIEDFSFSYLSNRIPSGIGPSQILAFSKLVTRMVTRVMYRVTGLTSLQVGAATRALFHVKSVIMTFEAPLGQGDQAWLQWVQRVEKTAIFLMESIDDVYQSASIEHEGIEALPAIFPAAEQHPYAN